MAFKGDDATFSVATTVTLAIAVAAVVFVKVPLKSSRPSGNGTDLNGATSELKAHARLWEDPFAAVQKDLEARKRDRLLLMGEGKVSLSGAGHAPAKSLMGEVRVKSLTSETEGDGQDILKEKITALAKRGGQVTALVVMTRGGSYVDDSESRIRDRFAVEAALEVGCFKPEQAQFLSYFTWNFKADSGSPSRSFATPYEWYRRSRIAACRAPSEAEGEGKDREVLVLWVAADEWGESILQHIDELLKMFRPPNVTPKVAANVTAKIVGPRSSSEFRSLLKEIQERGQAKKEGAGKKTVPFSWQKENGQMELYSPWATAMPGLLSYRLKGVSQGDAECRSYASCNDRFHQLLSVAGLDLYYRIDSDKVLFESLFEELNRRQVTVGKDSIVLIGEWDSFYARALPVTFSAAACRYRQQCSTTEQGVDQLKKGELSPQALNIRQYSYLSGLDGEVPEDRSSKPASKNEDKEKGDGDKAKLRDISTYEKPEGPSQLDYVRRLVTRIKSEEQDNTEGQRRKVKAIGILGTDTYDALLILQAVREQFPTVLFFATDLDARYFHENEQKWTRNVLVVSHFGLQLAPELQQSIPPFRNSYQTSTYLAVLKSIGQIEAGRYDENIPPRLFEIGRHGAVDLSVDRPDNGTESVHPSRQDVEADKRTVKLPNQIGPLWIVFVVLVFLMVWSHRRFWNWLTARDEIDDEARIFKRRSRPAWIALPALGALFLWCKILHFNYAEDEPFSWFDGVSVWPTELLRLFAALLCFYFLIKARADLVNNTEDLTKRFPLISQPTTTGKQRFWHELMGFGSNLDWIFHGSKLNGPRTAIDLWAQYCQAHTWPQRVTRIALWFLAYLVIIFPLWMFMNDGELRLFVPCRGEFSCDVDLYLTRTSVALLIVLNLAVLDAILLCTRWVNEMPEAVGLNPMAQIRLIVERTRIVNRRILYPFLALFLVMAARSPYFDKWDFPPALIMVLTVNSLLAIASASLLYLAAVGAKRRVLASIQEQLDRALTQDENAASKSTSGPSSDRLREIIDEIDSVQQGAFVPFYQQPVVQATLVAALAFLQYRYLGQ